MEAAIYFTGEKKNTALEVAPRQVERLRCYLSLIDENTERANDPYWRKHYLDILEAFGNDPKRAAQAFIAARNKGQAAMVKHSDERMRQVPYPDKKNPYERFDTIEEAEAHWQVVVSESLAISRKTVCREFYDKVDAYHQGQWEKAKVYQ